MLVGQVPNENVFYFFIFLGYISPFSCCVFIRLWIRLINLHFFFLVVFTARVCNSAKVVKRSDSLRAFYSVWTVHELTKTTNQRGLPDLSVK